MTGAPDEQDIYRVCVDCHAESPRTHTSYTLISSAHGWRLMRRVDENGRNIMEWRCPQCWAKHKAAHPDSLKGVRGR